LDRLNPFTLTFVGLGVALFSGVISLMIEGNFMASYFYDGVTLLSTPVLFDLGVFFIVIGVVSSVLSILRATTLKGDA
ncbi:MAG: hypothetical protein KDK78_05425, partial [Chlamydiia bacterium]|nr:hypothetical protein [Chlamydiia bacterium]